MSPEDSRIERSLVEKTEQFWRTDKMRALALKALLILGDLGIRSYLHSRYNDDRAFAIYADHIEVSLNILYWSVEKSKNSVNPFLWVSGDTFEPDSFPEMWSSDKISDRMKIVAMAFVENGFRARRASFDDKVYLRVLIIQDEAEGLTAELRFRDL